jgi:hypothetical protein
MYAKNAIGLIDLPASRPGTLSPMRCGKRPIGADPVAPSARANMVLVGGDVAGSSSVEAGQIIGKGRSLTRSVIPNVHPSIFRLSAARERWMFWKQWASSSHFRRCND